MKVRSAIAQDAERIALIHRQARQQAMPWLPIVHTAAEDLDYFREVVSSGQSVLVAETDTPHEIAGFAAFDQSWLNHLYVRPDRFRCGVGSTLLDIAQSSSKALMLWTFQQNHSARAFYAKHGFSEVEWTDGMRNEEQTPDVRMTWVNPARS